MLTGPNSVFYLCLPDLTVSAQDVLLFCHPFLGFVLYNTSVPSFEKKTASIVHKFFCFVFSVIAWTNQITSIFSFFIIRVFWGQT